MGDFVGSEAMPGRGLLVGLLILKCLSEVCRPRQGAHARFML